MSPGTFSSMKEKAHILFFLTCLLMGSSCEEGQPRNQGTGSSSNPVDGWLIPVDEVVSGGVSKDGIASLLLPDKAKADDPAHDYLSSNDLVLGIKSGGEICAYPHPFLDYHEIINDMAGDLERVVPGIHGGRTIYRFLLELQ